MASATPTQSSETWPADRWPLRPPDFFLIGVPRSGTTALYEALGRHPQIYVPPHKEACFTCPDIDPRSSRTRTRFIYDAHEYLGLFAAAQQDQLIGEGCIYNVYSPQAPRRIRELNPDARMLIQLRDPIEQMYSNHALKLIMVEHRQSFAKDLADQGARRGGRTEQPLNMADYDLRDKAVISPGLRRFINEFGHERVHVSLYEDFAADQPAVLAAILSFLGVDATFQPSVQVRVPNRTTRLDVLNRTMVAPRVLGSAKAVVPAFLHPVARRAAMVLFDMNRRRVRRVPLDPRLLGQLHAEFRSEVDALSELVGQDLAARWWH